MGRHGIHTTQVQQALAHVSRRKGVDELPRLHLGGAADHVDDLVLVHRVGAAMRERDLFELAVEMHRVLADEVDELDGCALGERDAVGHGHRAHRSGQLVALERCAIDNRRLAAGGHGLVQARVLRQLLGDEREHRGAVRRTEIAHELFGIGFLQLVDRAHLYETHGARERHGVAGRDDVSALRRLAVELVGVERQIAHRGQARA